MRRIIACLLSAGLLVLTSCVTTPMIQTPQGFAAYSEAPAGTVLRAVSPEGVTFRLRTEENDPPQTIDFWSEALQVHLERSGYALLESHSIDAPVGDVVAFEWVAPFAGEDWIYLTAVADGDSDILLVEAAGSYAHFSEYREAILGSLETLTTGER